MLSCLERDVANAVETIRAALGEEAKRQKAVLVGGTLPADRRASTKANDGRRRLNGEGALAAAGGGCRAGERETD